MFHQFKSNWFVFPLGAVRLCRCEHNNRTPKQPYWDRLGSWYGSTRTSERFVYPVNVIWTNYHGYIASLSCIQRCSKVECKDLYGLAASCETNLNSPCSLIVQNTAPASCIYFCCSRPRHIWPISRPNILMWFVRDSFRFAWSSFGFFSVWKQTKPQGKATSLQTHRLIQTRVNEL